MTKTEHGFQTERLIVESWQPWLSGPRRGAVLAQDLKDLLTPNVLRNLPEPMQLSNGPTAISDWIAGRAVESDVFAIQRRGSDAVIGLLILARFDELDGPSKIHLGYLLAEPVWGQGYGSELLQGFVGWQRGLDGPTELIAGVEPTNPGSARVLEKAGFRPLAAAPGCTVMYQLTV